MGAIHFSIDINLINAIRQVLPISVFVETGTYEGGTSALVADLFESVYTIELSPEMHHIASRNLGAYLNVSAIHGDSVTQLRKLAPGLKDESTMYWLDAHWCGSVTAGTERECPLLPELNAIGSLNESSVILIDDARLFLEPPPAPHDAGQWPTICEVIEGLQKTNRDHKTYVINDVIVFAPRNAVDEILQYSRRHGTDLLKLIKENARARQGEQLVTAEAGGDDASPQSSELARSARSGGGSMSANHSESAFVSQLKRLQAGCVLDIGSKSGQFILKLRDLSFDGVVYSIEPQSNAYSDLVDNAKTDNRWIPLPRQRVGNENEVRDPAQLADHPVSSSQSIPEMGVTGGSAPQTVAAERIHINSTGEVLRPFVLNDVAAIRLDVQGCEGQVLDGYRRFLPNVRLILVKGILNPGEDAPDNFELDRTLVDEYGFTRLTLESADTIHASSEPRQYDAVYHRPDAPDPPAQALGIAAVSVFTSTGRAGTRLSSNKKDVGKRWRERCIASWNSTSAGVYSVGETPPDDDRISWIKTDETPSINQILGSMAEKKSEHSLLVTPDIRFTRQFWHELETLDPRTIYYGKRTDVLSYLRTSGELLTKSAGEYPYGFDYFLMPLEFVRFVESERIIPNNFQLGQPWWDALIPVAALAYGFPLKRLNSRQVLAEHHKHQVAFSIERWGALGGAFMSAVERMRADQRCVAGALLDELHAIGRSGKSAELYKVSHVISFRLP